MLKSEVLGEILLYVRERTTPIAFMSIYICKFWFSPLVKGITDTNQSTWCRLKRNLHTRH